MIVPRPRSRIWGSTACIMRNAPKKFVSNNRLPASMGRCSTGPMIPQPRVVHQDVHPARGRDGRFDRRIGVDIERQALGDVELVEHLRPRAWSRSPRGRAWSARLRHPVRTRSSIP